MGHEESRSSPHLVKAARGPELRRWCLAALVGVATRWGPRVRRSLSGGPASLTAITRNLTWDARDATGRGSPAGLYVARPGVGDRILTRLVAGRAKTRTHSAGQSGGGRLLLLGRSGS